MLVKYVNSQLALDNHYANKFAPLDSMTIYLKPVKHISIQSLTSETKFPTNIPLPCADSISSPCR